MYKIEFRDESNKWVKLSSYKSLRNAETYYQRYMFQDHDGRSVIREIRLLAPSRDVLKKHIKKEAQYVNRTPLFERDQLAFGF